MTPARCHGQGSHVASPPNAGFFNFMARMQRVSCGSAHAEHRGIVMGFESILYPEAVGRRDNGETPEAPAFFVDLNLDQIVAAVTKGKEEYELAPFFHDGPLDLDTIHYRHEIMRDLERPAVMQLIKAFAGKMRDARAKIAQADDLHYQLQKQAWFLDAVETYARGVVELRDDLVGAPLASQGLTSFRDYVHHYVQSEAFATLLAQTETQRRNLESVTYCILIGDGGFEVTKGSVEADYSAEVERAFEKFRQGDVKSREFKFKEQIRMNHIEAAVLDGVATMYPEIFAALDGYCVQNDNFVDEVISRFDRQIQFYVAYLDHIGRLRQAGLTFCYPRMSDRSKEVHDRESFDLALAHKFVGENKPVISNDFHLRGPERIAVISGPNQGGKTTFARMFGQLHYLAALGCPVPGRDAALFLFDRLFAHFERPEKIENLRGKLRDDLVRIHEILIAATPRSIIIMNEIFSSTALEDAVFLAKHVMARIMQLDALGVCVTFLDELASLGPKTVSMVATVVPEEPSRRTFKIVRKPADGLAYAVSLAERYRLTLPWVRRRIAS